MKDLLVKKESIKKFKEEFMGYSMENSMHPTSSFQDNITEFFTSKSISNPEKIRIEVVDYGSCTGREYDSEIVFKREDYDGLQDKYVKIK